MMYYFRANPLGMKGHIAQRYGELVKDMWSGSTKTTAPLKLRVMLMPKFVHLVMRTLILLHANNNVADQPVHLCSLVF